MKLWMSLYAMIWIVLIEFLLAMTPGASPVLIYLHVILGAAIVGLAFYNFSGIRMSCVPGRVKHIAQVSFNISVLVAILGALLFFDVGKVWVIPLINVSFYGLIILTCPQLFRDHYSGCCSRDRIRYVGRQRVHKGDRAG